jgi:hypothetical protein
MKLIIEALLCAFLGAGLAVNVYHLAWAIRLEQERKARSAAQRKARKGAAQ